MKRLLLLLSLPGVIRAMELPLAYVCPQASSEILIDGKLNDVAWGKAEWTDVFVDIEGAKRPAPRFKTQVKMLWDDRYFYIGAHLAEPHVWATIAKPDDVIFHDNDFEVFMDPNGDNFEYGEFEINAMNTGWDLFLDKPYKDDGHADDSWNIEGIRTAVFVNGTLNDPADTDSGWSVEIAMPWASLERISQSTKAPPDGRQWRVNFSRVEWMTNIVDGKYKKVEGKPEDNWVWSPQGVVNMHRPEMWGIVQFARDPQMRILPDRFAAARVALHTIYYAEKDFFEKNKRWAASLTDLSIGDFTNPLIITLNDSGFTATQKLSVAAAHIRQDSYFWVDSLKSR